MKIIIFLFIINQLFASTLVMIGGGTRPNEILSTLLNSSPKIIPNVLVLPWGTSSPKEACEIIKKQFSDLKNINFKCFLKNILASVVKEELQRTDILYFPGGDQNKIMSLLNKKNLIPVIQNRFAKDMSVGGTSAGTAIQSRTMLNGHDSDTAEGLGLLENFIVDQHFLVRNRQERLKKALMQNKISGLGIDEGTAAIIENDNLRVLGESQVWVYPWPDIENPVKLSSGMQIKLPPKCNDLLKIKL